MLVGDIVLKAGAELLFALISQRNGRSAVLVTSNLAVSLSRATWMISRAAPHMRQS